MAEQTFRSWLANNRPADTEKMTVREFFARFGNSGAEIVVEVPEPSKVFPWLSIGKKHVRTIPFLSGYGYEYSLRSEMPVRVIWTTHIKLDAQCVVFNPLVITDEIEQSNREMFEALQVLADDYVGKKVVAFPEQVVQLHYSLVEPLLDVRIDDPWQSHPVSTQFMFKSELQDTLQKISDSVETL